MKTVKRGMCVAAAVVAAGAAFAAKAADDPREKYSTAGWTLDWSDEFDGKGTPDESKWKYEVGFVRNHEPQYYTSNRVENCRVADGVLTITARREKWPNPLWADRRLGGWFREREFANYTSAAIETKRAFLYGRLEIRAKMPGGWGAWPALWTIGENVRLPKSDPAYYDWPACGEIDIVEIWGNNPTRVAACLHTAKRGRTGEPGEKYRPNELHAVTGGGDGRFTKPGEEPWNGFHTYTLDWYEDKMVMFYDGHPYARVNLAKSDWPDGQNPFRKPHFLIMNLALGGWGNKVVDVDTVDEKSGKTIPAAKFPMEMQIDWVRHYGRSTK